MGIIYSNYGYSLYEMGYVFLSLSLAKYGNRQKIQFLTTLLIGSCSEYEEAEECFDKAIKLAPRHAQAYYNRAVLNAEMNDFTQAIDDCKTMLSLNPDLYEPNAFMGW